MLDGEQIEVMELNLAIARLTFSVSCDITTFHKNRDSYLHTTGRTPTRNLLLLQSGEEKAG
jgi:hypothetical protein